MKENIIIKSLTLFSFIIFSLPFLQTCSDSSIKRLPGYKGEFTGLKIDTTKVNSGSVMNLVEVSQIEKEKIITQDKFNRMKFFIDIQKVYTNSAYNLGLFTIREFELRFIKDPIFYSSAAYTLIILFSIIIVIVSFKMWYKIIIILDALNLIILSISTLILIQGKIIEEINQIKYGFYIFVLNSIVIIFLSIKELDKLKK